MKSMLSVKEVAERFRKDVTTIQRWIKQGHFPGAYKTGPGKNSPYVIPEEAVTALMNKLSPTQTQSDQQG